MWEHNERMKGEDSNLPLADHNLLLKRRKEELRHAQDIKELYERKLEKVNDLYLELHAMKIQLEERERTLSRRERQISFHGSKVQYKKKKTKPFVVTTPHRFQPRASRSLSTTGARCRKSSPSTPEVLSTSPEAPASKEDRDFRRPQFIATPLPSEMIASDVTKIVVRENPVFLLNSRCTAALSGSSADHNTATTSTTNPPPSNSQSHCDGAAGVDWDKIKHMHYANKNLQVYHRQQRQEQAELVGLVRWKRGSTSRFS